MKTRLLVLLALSMTALPSLGEIVVVTNPANPATRMLPDQVAQFYLGSSNIFTPLDHAKDSQIHKEFYEKS